MKSINSLAICQVLGIATLLLAACANQMEPAEQALEEIYNVVMAATADGTKYVPDQMASVQKELGELQSSYDKKDYAAVLAHAPAVLADAKSLAAAATDKKGEIAKTLDTPRPNLSLQTRPTVGREPRPQWRRQCPSERQGCEVQDQSRGGPDRRTTRNQ